MESGSEATVALEGSVVGVANPRDPRPDGASAVGHAARPASASLGARISLVRNSDPGEIRVQPDLSQGLDRYAAAARRLGLELVATGRSQGVATFSRPIQLGDLQRLSDLGMSVLQVEAVSTGDGADRWTAFAENGPQLDSQLAELFAEVDADMLGIVSATVSVSSTEALAAVTGDADVFLIDLSPEQARRSHPSEHDIVMNDLYWHLAGWLD